MFPILPIFASYQHFIAIISLFNLLDKHSLMHEVSLNKFCKNYTNFEQKKLISIRVLCGIRTDCMGVINGIKWHKERHKRKLFARKNSVDRCVKVENAWRNESVTELAAGRTTFATQAWFADFGFGPATTEPWERFSKNFNVSTTFTENHLLPICIPNGQQIQHPRHVTVPT